MCVEKILTTLALTTLVVLSGCSDTSDNRNSVSAFSASPTVTLANLNILHGFDCDPPAPADGNQCRVRERVALLREHLIAQGCLDLVTLQEVINAEFAPTAQGQPVESIILLIEAELPNLAAVCGFTYQMVYKPLLTVALSEIDEEVILSRYPVLQIGTRNLYGTLYDQTTGNGIFARHALYARIDHPSGEVDVYTTHLASGSDFATSECVSGSCPMECNSGGTVRACQAEQLALYVEQTRGTDNLALITGDFNAVPDSSEYLSMTSRGWLDSHIVADQPECDSASGIGCTGGRESSAEDLEDPALKVDRRIDYIFVVLPEGDGSCIASIESDLTGTYDVTAAGLFAAEPNPFSENCGSPPNPMCWVSDHSGNLARLSCKS
jgi:endonuclease/exonuclease/phosphatase family metal-dependent hydrolase